MTYYCPECHVAWFPYMTGHGVCPACGGGTRRTHDPATQDVGVLYKAACAERDRLDRLAAFDDFCVAREMSLNGLDELPVVEPERKWAA